MKKAPEAFRTISEVSEILETPAHVLRFWESKFYQIRPVKRAGGRRYYRPDDVALINGIRVLLQDHGMTIRGVQRVLQEQGIKHVAALGGPLPLGDSETIVDSDAHAAEPGADHADRQALEPDPIEPRGPGQADAAAAGGIVQQNARETEARPGEPNDLEQLVAPPEIEATNRMHAAETSDISENANNTSDVADTSASTDDSGAAAETGLPIATDATSPVEPLRPVSDRGDRADNDESHVEEPQSAERLPSDTKHPTNTGVAMTGSETVPPAAAATAVKQPTFNDPDKSWGYASGARPQPPAPLPDDVRIAKQLRNMPRGGLGRNGDAAALMARRIDALLERMSEASGAGRW